MTTKTEVNTNTMSKDTKKEEIIEDFPKIIRLSSSGEHPELGAGTFLTVEKREFYNWLSDKLDLYAEQVRREMAKKFYDLWREKFGYDVVRWNKSEGDIISIHDMIEKSLKEHPQHD